MTNSKPTTKDPDKPTDDRGAYATPKLTVYGNVGELTQAGSNMMTETRMMMMIMMRMAMA